MPMVDVLRGHMAHFTDMVVLMAHDHRQSITLQHHYQTYIQSYKYQHISQGCVLPRRPTTGLNAGLGVYTNGKTREY